MDEHIEDFEDRIYAILSTRETKDKKNIVTVDFVGFNDSQEMKLFKDFIASNVLEVCMECPIHIHSQTYSTPFNPISMHIQVFFNKT